MAPVRTPSLLPQQQMPVAGKQRAAVQRNFTSVCTQYVDEACSGIGTHWVLSSDQEHLVENLLVIYTTNENLERMIGMGKRNEKQNATEYGKSMHLLWKKKAFSFLVPEKGLKRKNRRKPITLN